MQGTGSGVDLWNRRRWKGRMPLIEICMIAFVQIAFVIAATFCFVLLSIAFAVMVWKEFR